MIIFNTTFHIEDDVHDMGICFLRETYIPSATNSGFLFEPRLARIHQQYEEKGSSYSLQFRVKNIDSLNHWMSTEGQSLLKELTQRFGNKIMGFITLMDEISL